MLKRAMRLSAAAVVGLGLAHTAYGVSYTFPSVNINPVPTTEVLVPLNVAGAPNVLFDEYMLTVNWSAIAGGPWSNEARMRLLSGATNLVGGATATSGIAPGSGGANNGNPTTLTWSGFLNQPYMGGAPLSIGARQAFAGSSANWQNASLALSQFVPPTGGSYVIDDGTAEDSIGVTGTAPFDMVWLNRFPVQQDGEIITNIQIAFGNPGNSSTGISNGMPVQVLLYEDADGGSPTNAVLKASVNGTVQSLNTNTFIDFDIPDTLISNTLLVGAVMRNLPGGNAFIAGIDQTDPDFNNRSFLGFTTGTTTPPSPLDINNLGGMGTNFGSTDSFGLPGNFLIRATGVPVPEPAAAGVLAMAGLFALRRRRNV